MWFRRMGFIDFQSDRQKSTIIQQIDKTSAIQQYSWSEMNLNLEEKKQQKYFSYHGKIE